METQTWFVAVKKKLIQKVKLSTFLTVFVLTLTNDLWVMIKKITRSKIQVAIMNFVMSLDVVITSCSSRFVLILPIFFN